MYFSWEMFLLFFHHFQIQEFKKISVFCFYVMQENCSIGLGKRQEAKRQSEILEYDTVHNSIKTDSQIVKDYGLPPLVCALKASAEENAASFHFPGHNRGHAAPSSLRQLIGVRPFLHDLPELPELDNLFAPEGPILEAQKQAAKLFGASETWFLVGGSTCGVQTAIMATCLPGDTLILPRNSHMSAISAMILSGVLPKYIVPEYDHNWDIAGGISHLQASRIKCLFLKKPKVVFDTKKLLLHLFV